MKKKVLFVMHTLGYGGAERSLVNLLHELPEDRYEVDLLLFQKKGALLQQLPSWVRVLETPDRLNRLYGPTAKAGVLALPKVLGTGLARLARKKRKPRTAWRWKHVYKGCIESLPGHYDVAAAFGGTELMYYIHDKVDAARRLVWIHTDYRTGEYAEEYDRPYLEKTDKIISVSPQCVRVLEEIFPPLRDRMCCVENITSSALVRERAGDYVPQEYANDGCTILSVGRLWGQKGFDLAVDAAAVLKENGFLFHWFIVGEGVLRNTLQRQINSLGLEKHVQLIGTRENPYPYMKHCTVLVQPSRCEGKSVVLDEAKILAVPVVATAYPTVHDQIDGENEGLIAELTPAGLAEQIQRLCEDPQLYAKIREHLQAREYGNAAEVKKYMALLDE